MKTLRKLIYFLTLKQRKQVSLLVLMILIMALLEMIGVASILPFIAILSNPEIIETNIFLNSIFKVSGKFGVETNQQFLFFFGAAVFILLIASLGFKAFTTYVQMRFVQMCQYTISKRFVEGYLNQPYSWFLNRHSADLGKTILSEVGAIVKGGISPMMDLIAKGMITISMITLLILTDPKLALIIGFSIGVAYGLIYKVIRSYVKRIGKETLDANKSRFEAVIEAFGAAKEVKVGGLEKAYLDRFSLPARTYAMHQASSQLVIQLPRYFLEAISFGGLLLAILYLMIEKSNFESALPIITLYAFAGYRLIPALQQIFGSITHMRFIDASLNSLYNDLKSLKKNNLKQKNEILSFEKEITLNNIVYNYPNSSRTALKNISFSIPAKTSIGLVGATGSGKTTMVDIILGLLESQVGTLEVDGEIITKNNCRSWQRSIGYVPQNIFISDDTVSANIAFGVNPKDVDQEAVVNAAKIASLDKFIINELPLKYQTSVGERGVRLSGGQRQRIGIARALYHDPKILIFDEATSALDNQTEKIVMETLYRLKKKITIIMIAHRLRTVKECDKIFILENGELVGQGNYNELLQNNKKFIEMVGKNQ
jgi:ATP-binding cassette, subfamily B, bacterial PglK